MHAIPIVPAAGGRVVKASPASKLAIVKGREGTPFFNTVRGRRRRRISPSTAPDIRRRSGVDHV